MDRQHGRTGTVSRGLRVVAGVLSFFVLFTIQPAYAQDPQPPADVPLPSGMSAWKLILNENFDGTANEQGINVKPGLYFYSADHAGTIQTGKIMYVR